MNKPTLFYSQKCTYSQEICATLNKHSIIDNYELVNIDTLSRIPPFVQVVPLLFHENKVLHDEGLFNYIDTVITKSEPIQAFTLDTGLTDAFSFISEGDSKELSKQYLEVSTTGEFMEQKIETPAEMDDAKKTQTIEELMFKRDKEVKNI